MLHDDIMRQNGKQTIYQMLQFAERIKERGGKARDALWYKRSICDDWTNALPIVSKVCAAAH